EDLGRPAEVVVAVAVGADVDVRRQTGRSLTGLALDLLADELLEEVLHLGAVAVRPDDGELAREEDALLVDGREREPVVVDPGLGVVREERVDEARLTVEPAARLLVEHRQRSVAEGDVDGARRPAEDVALLE